MANRWESYFENAARAAETAGARPQRAAAAGAYRAARKAWSAAKKGGNAASAEYKSASDAVGATKGAWEKLRKGEGGLGAGPRGVAWLMRKLGKQGPSLAIGALPLAVPLATRMGMGLVRDIGEPISQLTRGAPLGKPSLDTMLQLQAQAEEAAMQQNIRDREIDKLAAINEQRLMTAAPQVATQILAGRRLPQGAVVIGGRPRTDLLRQFAVQMATDPTYAQAPEAASEQFLGGVQ